MNATYRFAVKACVVAAVSSPLYSQPTSLFAQAAARPASASAQSNVKPTVALPEADDATVTPPPASAVMKYLEEEYRKNGRQMPSMNLNELPNVQQKSAVPNVPGSRNVPTEVSTQENRPKVVPAKPNFFERLFGVGKARKPAAPVGQPTNSIQSASPVQSTNPATTTPPPQPRRFFPLTARPSVQQPATPRVQQSLPQRLPQPLARQATPSSPTPTSTGTKTIITPAQPLFREPAPVSPPPAGAREQPALTAVPPARPAPLSSSRSFFINDANPQDDSESLDLNPQPKTTGQAPQILPDRATGGIAESPYSGLTISPNESEQKIAGKTQAAVDSQPEATSIAREPAKLPAAGPATEAVAAPIPSPATEGPTLPAAKIIATEPVSLPAAESTIPPAARIGATETSAVPAAKSTATKAVETTLPSIPKAPARKPTAIDLGLKDEDDADDDDDDDESLTIPTESSAVQPEKPAHPVTATEIKPSEKTPIAKIATDSSAVQPGNVADPATAEVDRQSKQPAIAKIPTGLGGFCPVALKDERKLLPALSEFKAEYRGKTFSFSSADAKTAFEDNPPKYIPAGEGKDVVRLTAGEGNVEGTLEHAAWFRGRLYLFSSAESRREFVETPAKFMVNE